MRNMVGDHSNNSTTTGIPSFYFYSVAQELYNFVQDQPRQWHI
jgi:hypothetical protein